MVVNKMDGAVLTRLCNEFKKYNNIEPELYEKYQVKRGLRNSDGTGVMAGLTHICNVHGYVVNDGERMPVDGKLIYRGIDMNDIIAACENEQRFGFEEVAWLLLFGTLPTAEQLQFFSDILGQCRNLPEHFVEDMILKAPSPDVMNKLSRCVLALYTYDESPDDISLENLLNQSINLIAKLPAIMTCAFQVKRHHYDGKSMYFHQINSKHSTSEAILNATRLDRKFTKEEALLLDLCLIMHAEHGGGNNSTFATRVLSSSGTDTYAAISAAIGSLKGPKHGGANLKVMEMLSYMKAGIKDYNDDEEIMLFIEKIIKKETGDRTGLVYGMGHAVYTLSDPRAIILREKSEKMAKERGFEDDFKLINAVERLTPEVFTRLKGDTKVISPNVDLYSGLVYKMIGINDDIFTPIFAIARVAGWCAHRIEEVLTGGRIIRPAYKSVEKMKPYIDIKSRIVL